MPLLCVLREPRPAAHGSFFQFFKDQRRQCWRVTRPDRRCQKAQQTRVMEGVIGRHQDGAPVMTAVVLEISVANQPITHRSINSCPFGRIWKFDDVVHWHPSSVSADRIAPRRVPRAENHPLQRTQQATQQRHGPIRQHGRAPLARNSPGRKTLPCLALPCRASPCRAAPRPAKPRLAAPRPATPRLAAPGPASPSLARPAMPHQTHRRLAFLRQNSVSPRHMRPTVADARIRHAYPRAEPFRVPILPMVDAADARPGGLQIITVLNGAPTALQYLIQESTDPNVSRRTPTRNSSNS
jgi:hypothetical protein